MFWSYEPIPLIPPISSLCLLLFFFIPHMESSLCYQITLGNGACPDMW